MMAVSAQFALANTIQVYPEGAPRYASDKGIMSFEISNPETSEEGFTYKLEVLSKDMKPIPLDQWRSSLTNKKDDQTIHLSPGESRYFSVQFRNKGKYLACSTKEVSTYQPRVCLRVIYQ
jgi:hypothetical protein